MDIYDNVEKPKKPSRINQLFPEGIATLFPSTISKLNKINLIRENMKKVSFEVEGMNLLRKTVFNDKDKEVYKLLLLKDCIPKEYIGKFWFISSGAKREMHLHPGYYKYLLEKYPSYLNFNYVRQAILVSQIEKDIPRTLNKNSNNDINFLTKLSNILICYNRRNLSVRYVQGFNFIVAHILNIINDEEKAFWVFVQLIENILPNDYFPDEMIGLMVDVNLLVCLLRDIYAPNLIESLNAIEGRLYLENLFIQWFVSLFSHHFPTETSQFLWHVLFVDRKIVLFKACISIVEVNREEMETINNIEKLQYFLDGKLKKFEGLIYLKYCLLIKDFEFDEEFLEINRNKLLDYMRKKLINSNKEKIAAVKNKLKLRTDQCNINWPFCIYDADFKYSYSDVMIFKCLRGVENVIDGYFSAEYQAKKRKKEKLKGSSKNSSNNSLILSKDLNFENILVERKAHCCFIYNKNTEEDICSDSSKENSINMQDSGITETDEEDFNIRKKLYKKVRNKQPLNSYSYVNKLIMNTKSKDNIYNNDNGNNVYNNFNTKIDLDIINNYYKYSMADLAQLSGLEKIKK